MSKGSMLIPDRWADNPIKNIQGMHKQNKNQHKKYQRGRNNNI